MDNWSFGHLNFWTSELLDNWTFWQLNFWTFELKISCPRVRLSKVQLSIVQLSLPTTREQTTYLLTTELLKTELLDNWSFGQLNRSSDVQKFSCPTVQMPNRSVVQKIRNLEFSCLKFRCPALILEIKRILMVTWASLRWKGKNERGGAFPSSHSTSQTLRLEVSKLLHEIWTLHQSHIRKMEIAKDLIFESSRSFLIGAR